MRGTGRPHQGWQGPFPSIHRCFPPDTSFLIMITTPLCSTAYLAPGKGDCVPKSVCAFFPEALGKGVMPLYESCLSHILRRSWCYYWKKNNKHLIHLKDLRCAWWDFPAVTEGWGQRGAEGAAGESSSVPCLSLLYPFKAVLYGACFFLGNRSFSVMVQSALPLQ